jgi:large subunit ribosomal protein L22
MEYQATAKYIRTSTRKMRLVADMIRPLAPLVALVQLEHMPQLASKPLASVLASAIANAKQKNVAVDALSFKIIEVMGGPSMKRWHAVSRGQAHSYKKRMTHVRIVLTDEKTENAKILDGGKK